MLLLILMNVLFLTHISVLFCNSFREIIVCNSVLDGKPHGWLVTLLTEDNFKSKVMESTEMWLVAFIDPKNNGKTIESEYIQVAKKLNGKVNCGKSFSTDLARQWGVKYFPTIMYFPTGDKSIQNENENYEGDIKANDIVTWALEIYNGEPFGKYRVRQTKRESYKIQDYERTTGGPCLVRFLGF